QATISRDAYLQQMRYREQAISSQVSLIEGQVRDGLIDQPAAIAALGGLGIPATVAGAITGAILGEAARRTVDAIVAILRREWVEGITSNSQAAAGLIKAGLTPAAANARVVAWQAELPPHHHAETATEILGWVSKGLMSVRDAKTRLTNLGWSGLDESLAL